MYHPNTAPFLAIRFAQRFGISNPSPRYVKRIAQAFRTGSFVSEGVTFGSGVYGDLASTFAALLLDRESRSVVLDADPMHGSILEPLLKVVRVMRSLEFALPEYFPLVRTPADLTFLIGEGPHQLPNVFSFFNPEFIPVGPISRAGLVLPEAQVLSGSKSTNLLNILLSFIKYGISSCYQGIGFDIWYFDANFCSIDQHGQFAGSTTYEPLEGWTPRQIVDDLATLLTSGRLGEEKREFAAQIYTDTLASEKSALEALVNVQQIIALSPEFHVNTVVRATTTRAPPVNPPPSTKPYKAVIYLFLGGGYDSYSMMVPQTCSTTNTQGQSPVEQYMSERGALAFTEDERLVVIDAASSDQPCEEFALHDELTLLKELYDQGELTFFANMGQIDQNGLTKDNYYDLTTSELFSHDDMQVEAQRVDPYSEAPGTGILGRAANYLQEAGYSVNTISIDNLYQAVKGGFTANAVPPLVVGRYGAETFNPKPWEEEYFNSTLYALLLNNHTVLQSSIFGETWSSQITSGIYNGVKLTEYLQKTNLSEVWDNYTYDGDYESDTMYTLMNVVAKLIKTRDDRGTDRDLFFANYDGWDHHSDTKASVRPKFRALNHGLALMVEELKNQTLWDDVVIVVASEFARTLTPNSGGGTDHAWGGTYWMMGGGVKGGRILGRYPDDITEDADLLVGEGRVIPTTSWDALWNGVVEWFGVDNEEGLDMCLPNRNNVVEPGFQLFTQDDLFQS